MSQTTPPPLALRKLPVGATFAEAYSLVFGRLGLLVKAAAFPYLISTVLAVLSLTAPSNWALAMIVVILGFVPYTIFGVSWHRVTLLGPSAGAPSMTPAWKRRHSRFLGYALAVTLIGYGLVLVIVLSGALLAMPLGASAELILALAIVFGGLVVFFYMIMRLSFVFPAVAVDEAYRLAHAWTHTRGQGFRLIGLMILTALPMIVAYWVLGGILGLAFLGDLTMPMGTEGVPPEAVMQDFVAGSTAPFIVFQLIMTAVGYLLTALMVSAISIAFRSCTGWVPAAGGAVMQGTRED
ncbi:MAG: hypothetical protein IH805_05650 [Proteobacteria bacterium]|nr:hypothetical protein [Pseudomonadota bacterium]